MDNLTHTLVGATLARAGIGRRTPLATATLIVAANAPDVDVLSYARGPMFALSFRRGITHGVPALAVLPFAVAGAVVAWDRLVRAPRHPDADSERASFAALLPIAVLGLLTHPVLDWMNTYGMRWWLPFDGRWSYGDSLFIVDPWLWLLLGGAAALGGARDRAGAALWAALAAVTSWIVLNTPLAPAGAKVVWAIGVAALALAWVISRQAEDAGRLRTARALGSLAVLYVGAMVLTHRAAARDVHAALSAGLAADPADAVMVGPLPARPLRSEVLVQLPGAYVRGAHDWTADQPVTLELDQGIPDVAMVGDVGQPDALAAIAAARLDPDVTHYLVWSRFPYWRVARAPAGYSVTVGDMRYVGRGGLGGLTVTVGGR